MQTSAWRIARDLTIDFTFYTLLFLAMYSIDMFIVMEKDQITLTEAFGMHFFLLFWGWQVWLSMLLFWISGGLFAFSISKTTIAVISKRMRVASLSLYYIAIGIIILMLSFYYRISDFAPKPVAIVLGLSLLGIVFSVRSYFRQKEQKEF